MMTTNKVLRPFTPDGRTGFDGFNQLMSWSKPDDSGYTTGKMILDVRGCTCYICGKGWELTTEHLQDQVVVSGDLMHQTCFYGYQKLTSKKDIQQMVIDAGYLFQMEEAPCDCSG
jgi:hypothetical protein